MVPQIWIMVYMAPIYGFISRKPSRSKEVGGEDQKYSEYFNEETTLYLSINIYRIVTKNYLYN